MIFLKAQADPSEASACCPMTCNSEQHSESVGLLSNVPGLFVILQLIHAMLVRGLSFISTDASLAF